MSPAPDARPARRPRVICHMMTSIDGRILTDGWPLSPEGRRQYEPIHASYDPDAWLCGRVTMEQHFAQGARSDAEVAREHHGAPREDFRAPGDHDSFAFAVDGRGKLAWETVVNGRVGTPALFDVEGDSVRPQRLALDALERRADDVLWLRYRVVPR